MPAPLLRRPQLQALPLPRLLLRPRRLRLRPRRARPLRRLRSARGGRARAGGGAAGAPASGSRAALRRLVADAAALPAGPPPAAATAVPARRGSSPALAGGFYGASPAALAQAQPTVAAALAALKAVAPGGPGAAWLAHQLGALAARRSSTPPAIAPPVGVGLMRGAKVRPASGAAGRRRPPTEADDGLEALAYHYMGTPAGAAIQAVANRRRSLGAIPPR